MRRGGYGNAKDPSFHGDAATRVRDGTVRAAWVRSRRTYAALASFGSPAIAAPTCVESQVAVYLTCCNVVGVSPFGTAEFPFRTADGDPRLVTVIHGGGGVGKTALLQILASTRPGYSAVLVGRAMPEATAPPHAVCEWQLGDDDPNRPHPLVLVTPNVRPPGDDELSALRRREQALFERYAKERGGFVFLSISSARWFSRQAVALHAPLRTIGKYDVRVTASFDDASHSDLTRETKQALAYAGISSALAPTRQRDRNDWRERHAIDTRLFGNAMREMVDTLVQLVGFRYEGIDPASLEPTFVTMGGTRLIFERLSTRARHLVAFAALSIRTLWAAYPGRDPRTAEGVIAIDEVDLHQDPAVAERLVGTLRTALPRVQWILTTSSSGVAASVDAREVLALRRMAEDERVELFLDEEARTH